MLRYFSRFSFRISLIAGFILLPILARAQETEDKQFNVDESRLIQGRQDFFNSRLASGEIKDLEQIRSMGYQAVRSMDNRAAFKANAIHSSWKQIAGSQENGLSGRIRQAAFIPGDPNTIYIAASQGGVWKTTNALATPGSVIWTPIADNIGTLSVGAVAVDPVRPNIVYVGTGELSGGYHPPNAQGGDIPGIGIFRSTDGGANWTNVDPVSKSGGTVHSIMVDPKNTDRVFAATGNGTGCLQFSSDAGQTWSKMVNGLPAGFTAYTIAIDPTDPQKIYVSSYSSGLIYRTVDGGASWTKCTLPVSFNSSVLAIAPSATNTIYAGTCKNNASGGILRSTDFGVSWTVMNTCTVDPTTNNGEASPNVNYLKDQGEYDNAIAVAPDDPDFIVVGGITIHGSVNGGTTLKIKMKPDPRDPRQPQFVHADCHQLVFSNGKLYALTDGGISVTGNITGSANWDNYINKSISTLQFVDVDADKNFTYVLGGTQDNSLNRATIDAETFHNVRSGDAGRVWISQLDGRTCLSTYVFETLFKSTDSGYTWSENTILNPDLKGKNGAAATFYPVIDASEDGSLILFAARNRLYYSEDGSGDLSQRTDTQTGEANCFYVSPDNNDLVWAGTSGKIWYSDDKAKTFKGATGVSTGAIIGITGVPGDDKTLYAVSSGVTSPNNARFMKSTDGGATWKSNIAVDFPALSPFSFARNPTTSHLFVGTNFGVIYSTDDGVHWLTLNDNLPLCAVSAIKVRGAHDEFLLAGTYGRGMFYLNITGLGGVAPTQQPVSIALTSSYPNPLNLTAATESRVSFNLQKSGIATVILHDMLGREIRTLVKGYYGAGQHEVTLDARDLAPGTYYYSLISSGERVTEKLVITR